MYYKTFHLVSPFEASWFASQAFGLCLLIRLCLQRLLLCLCCVSCFFSVSFCLYFLYLSPLPISCSFICLLHFTAINNPKVNTKNTQGGPQTLRNKPFAGGPCSPYKSLSTRPTLSFSIGCYAPYEAPFPLGCPPGDP